MHSSFNSMIAEGGVYKEMLPYERFLSFGPECLTDAELLAVIIRTGTREASPVDIAGRILNLEKGKESGLNSLFSLSVEQLKQVRGVGEVKAIMLKCIAELAKRMASQRAKSSLDCSKSSHVAEYYMEKMRHEDKEKVILLCLNNRSKLIEEYLLAIGTVNSASLSPREVYIKALKCGASAVVLLHNHPGGDPTPSRADIAITNKIREAGSMIDIYLLDHIIIGDRSYISLADRGLLWK